MLRTSTSDRATRSCCRYHSPSEGGGVLRWRRRHENCRIYTLEAQGNCATPARKELLLRHVPLFVSDTQPSPLLLDPNIGEQVFPVRHLAIPFNHAKSVVSHDRYIPVIIDSEAMPILLHGVHLEHPGLEPSFNLSFIGRASIDTGLRDVLRVVLHDPVDRLGAASQKPRNLLVLDFHDLFLDRVDFRPGHLLRAK